MAKLLMKGNEAIAEAAILSGCKVYFGYPITPQNQIPEYMAKRMPKVGGCFLQAESEVAAINMVYGAAAAGARAMTSSSSPGISLKQEGISYIACAELPCVVVNMVRSGPGLGGISPSQGDYFQATKGGGHGDYHMVVYAPASVQEAADLTMEAFEVADMYRTPVMIMGDGLIGQVIEPVEFGTPKKRDLPEKTWAATGWDGKSRPRAVVNSLYIAPEDLEASINRMQARYKVIEENEVLVDEYCMEDAEICFAAFGSVARIAKQAVQQARKAGIKAGCIRPITLWPFPKQSFDNACSHVKKIIVAEMNTGQMVEDVKLAVDGRVPVEFVGTIGGAVPKMKDMLKMLTDFAEGK